jgi:hypothetical protein
MAIVLASLLVVGSLVISWHQTNREIETGITLTHPGETQWIESPQSTSTEHHTIQNQKVTGISNSAERAPVSAFSTSETDPQNDAPTAGNLNNPAKTIITANSVARPEADAPSPASLIGQKTHQNAPLAQNPTGNHYSALPVTIPQNVTAGAPSPAIPAAFGDPSVLGNLTDGQKATITQIANNFTKSVQASGAAPNTTEYLQAWDTAAYRADEVFRGQLGTPAFNAMQMARTFQP